MAHIAHPEAYSDDETADEDEISEPVQRGRASDGVVLSADRYIENVVGQASTVDSDVEITGTETRKSEKSKGKRKAGEKETWSSDEQGGNVYEKFKNRATLKRKKTAAARKSAKVKGKGGKGETSSKGGSKKNERPDWGDPEEEQILDEDIPDYIRARRKEFDDTYQKLHEAGLKTPPRYDYIEFSDDERLEELAERPAFPPSVEKSRPYEDIECENSVGVIPASIAQYLRDYQVEGVKFLHEAFVYQKGVILGDDMGLGKTVQVAAFLTAAFGKTGDERDAKRMRKMRRARGDLWYPRVLVVCPGSLIENWKNELATWGWWWVDKYHGNEKDGVLQAAKSGRLEVVITTYSTYKMNKDELNEVAWDCVVADECHQLKEGGAEVTKAMNQVNALCRIGLTGTAIQNKYEELWTLLNWTNPGRFGPLSTWKSSISEPLKMGQSHDATYHQLKQARQTAKKLVDNLLPQFFVRRMKSLIAHQLPKKSDRVVFCPLTEVQKEAYENFLASQWVETVRFAPEPCECNSGKKRGWCCHSTLPESNTKWQMTLVFPMITTLQKLSNHLALLIPNSTDPREKQERDLEFLQEMVPNRWLELYNNRDSIHNLANPEFCGKWKILRKLLKFWHENGDKVLIFSHSVKLLKMLEHLFLNTAYNVSFLSGSLSYEDRQKVVDEFNSDPAQFVFLISTKAGGVGLNITSANKVVIFDPNWNPSYDLQAQDRAYRIGQLRNVEVFRLVSAGTVEEIVYARQIYKQQQANIGYNASTERRYFKGVQNNTSQKGELFGLDNLLSFHADNIVLRDIVNKTNVAEAKRGVDILDVDLDAVLDEEEESLLKVDGEEDGEAAMSQLAKLLVQDPDKRKWKQKKEARRDPIQAILASAGVEYTHENSEVVGSSKVEAELSRRAEETGNDVEHGEERLFDDSQRSGRAAPGRGVGMGAAKIEYTFHPPLDVQIRQFCSMAKLFGFESTSAFALVVEGWTQGQRRACLERFYRRRREMLLPPGAGDGEGSRKEVEEENPLDEVEKLLAAGNEEEEEDSFYAALHGPKIASAPETDVDETMDVDESVSRVPETQYSATASTASVPPEEESTDEDDEL